MRARSTISVVFLLAMTGATAAAPPALRAPLGFAIELAAEAPLVRYPMFACLDDLGRLYVAESSGLDLYAELAAQTRKCQIRRLEDRDGDGVYETSLVFADQLVYPMGLAWRDGRLYVADPPNLVALEDRTGDGTADRRTVILSGFGHLDNGSLHGLTFGPDGLLYMTMGSPDGYRFQTEDGREVRGESGALIRCRPDGSQPEVVCRGFVNLVEIAFLPTGEIVGTDNWFQQPAGGLRDALVDLTAGGLYPYLADRGTQQPLTGVTLPPVSLFPAVALSGIERVRSGMWPAELRESLFTAQFNARRVVRHELVRSGSTFRTTEEDFITSDDPDFHPSDVLEDADGSLLVVDTGAWYVQHCPTGKIRLAPATGGIYRVRSVGARTADPRGHEIAYPSLGAAPLAALLVDPRPAVRDRAQQELTLRGSQALPMLGALLEGDGPTIAKQHAVWALAAMNSEPALHELRSLLAGADDELAPLVIRATGASGDRRAAPALAGLLANRPPQVRRAAAEALAACGSPAQVAALGEALATAEDAHEEHALSHALFRLASVEQLSPLLTAQAPAVRKAALMLLDQPPHRAIRREQAVALLEDEAPAVRAAAVAVLRGHPEWSGDVAGVVRRLLQDDRQAAAGDPAVRELATTFPLDAGVVGAVAEAITDKLGVRSAAARAILLEVAFRAAGSDPPESLREALLACLNEREPVLLRSAVRTAGARAISDFDAALVKIVLNVEVDALTRLAALQAVGPREPQAMAASIGLLRENLARGAAPELRLVAAQTLAVGTFDEATFVSLLEIVRADPLVSPDTLLPLMVRSARPDTTPAIKGYLTEAMHGGWRPAPVAILDGESAVFDDGQANSLSKTAADLGPPFQQLLARLEEVDAEAARRVANQAATRPDPVARLTALEPLLHGGDPGRGQQVFFNSRAACSTCHRLGNKGGSIGPDLTRIGLIRSGRDLLESIAVPSSTFAQAYETYLVVTADGQAFSGILVHQDERSVTLRDAGGLEHQFDRGSLEELRRLPSSLMPEGLDRVLKPEDLRDLLAFLGSLK